MMIDLLSGNCESIIRTLRYMNPETSDERIRYMDFYTKCLEYEVKNRNRWTVIKALTAKINKLKQNTRRK